MLHWRVNFMERVYEKIFVYCDADENGDIKNLIAGPAIVPDRQYQYFFIVDDWEIVDNQDEYRVQDEGLGKNKKLIRKVLD